MKAMKLGITGAGSFGESFIRLFKEHPHVSSIALAEVLPERRQQMATFFDIKETYDSHEALCASDVDAIAVMTQRHLHGPQAVAALNSGKHVFSAVPAASSLEEIEKLVRTVERTGLMYMMAETSYYYPAAIYCRQKFKAGEFGEFVYGEGEYLHDMAHGFYEAYQHSGGEHWQRVAGVPPMYYPTHSTSMIVSVTGASLTQVSCLGYVDQSDDNVFGHGRNLWDNPFSNQAALFRVSDGGMCRVNEFRRVGYAKGNSVRTSIFGTQGCFEQQGDCMFWTSHAGVFEDVTESLRCRANIADGEEKNDVDAQCEQYFGVADLHDVERLPAEFKGLPNGHFGAHQFLVDDFVRSVIQNKLAPNHVWAAAKYTAPGLVAHDSAMNEGELMTVPDFGDPPDRLEYIST